MANNQVETLTFTNTKEIDVPVIKIANRLGELEQRKPHDSIRLLLLEAGAEKINRLEEQSQEKSKGQGNE